MRNFEISDITRKVSELSLFKSKGADQLCSYCTADLHHCFCIDENSVLSWRGSPGHDVFSPGTVIRTTVVRMLEYEKEFICTKCRNIFTEKVKCLSRKNAHARYRDFSEAVKIEKNIKKNQLKKKKERCSCFCSKHCGT